MISIISRVEIMKKLKLMVLYDFLQTLTSGKMIIDKF
jgi:hypothetical protein